MLWSGERLLRAGIYSIFIESTMNFKGNHTFVGFICPNGLVTERNTPGLRNFPEKRYGQVTTTIAPFWYKLPQLEEVQSP
jgi:hypothetical protein